MDDYVWFDREGALAALRAADPAVRTAEEESRLAQAEHQRGAGFGAYKLAGTPEQLLALQNEQVAARADVAARRSLPAAGPAPVAARPPVDAGPLDNSDGANRVAAGVPAAGLFDKAGAEEGARRAQGITYQQEQAANQAEYAAFRGGGQAAGQPSLHPIDWNYQQDFRHVDPVLLSGDPVADAHMNALNENQSRHRNPAYGDENLAPQLLLAMGNYGAVQQGLPAKMIEALAKQTEGEAATTTAKAHETMATTQAGAVQTKMGEVAPEARLAIIGAVDAQGRPTGSATEQYQHAKDQGYFSGPQGRKHLDLFLRHWGDQMAPIMKGGQESALQTGRSWFGADPNAAIREEWKQVFPNFGQVDPAASPAAGADNLVPRSPGEAKAVRERSMPRQGTPVAGNDFERNMSLIDALEKGLV